MSSILVSFAISLAVNAACFAVAASRKTDGVTDLSYSLSFAALAIGLPLLDGAYAAAQLIAAGLVLVWAARLGAYLFARILRVKVDQERVDLSFRERGGQIDGGGGLADSALLVRDGKNGGGHG